MFYSEKKKIVVFLLQQELYFLIVFLLLPKNKTPGPVFRTSEHLQLPPTSATILFWTLLKTKLEAQWFLLLMKYTEGFLMFTQNLWFYSVSLKIQIWNLFIIISCLWKMRPCCPHLNLSLQGVYEFHVRGGDNYARFRDKTLNRKNES